MTQHGTSNKLKAHRLHARLSTEHGGGPWAALLERGVLVMGAMTFPSTEQVHLNDEAREFTVDCLWGLTALHLALAYGAAREHRPLPDGMPRAGLGWWSSKAADVPDLLARSAEGKGPCGHHVMLGEHTWWEVSTSEIAALLQVGFSVQPGQALEALRLLGGSEGWLPGVVPAHASWSTGAQTAAPPAPQRDAQGLRVAIFVAHHGDFQQCRSLLARASEKHWGGRLQAESYLLMLRLPAKQGAAVEVQRSFAGQPQPETRVEYTEILHLYDGTLAETETWVRQLVDAQGPLRSADLVAGCSPFWVCVALHRVLPVKPFVALVNMAILNRFTFHEDFPLFWLWLRDFLKSPGVAVAASHHLMAEQVFAQTGARPAYVPMVSLHIDERWRAEADAGVFVWRSAHPAVHFVNFLMRHRGLGGRQLVFHGDAGLVPYARLSEYYAVVMLPHVPNPGAMSDLYTLGIPLFLPAEPYIYRFLWDFSNPFAGPDANPLDRSRMPPDLRGELLAHFPVSATSVEHPFDPLDFLRQRTEINEVLLARMYWYQHTEFSTLPALQRFKSLAHLASQLAWLDAQRAAQAVERFSQQPQIPTANPIAFCLMRISRCGHLRGITRAEPRF